MADQDETSRDSVGSDEGDNSNLENALNYRNSIPTEVTDQRGLPTTDGWIRLTPTVEYYVVPEDSDEDDSDEAEFPADSSSLAVTEPYWVTDLRQRNARLRRERNAQLRRDRETDARFYRRAAADLREYIWSFLVFCTVIRRLATPAEYDN